mmetsp:Transcript_136416/g.435523  ORF Transcript_136416/g.435523 Transcript_136416/m.435523 type:complete len:457 (+) Transcript_136416:346-1716(+)
MRDSERLRKAPVQALSLQEVLGSVTVALSSRGAGLAARAAAVEGECRSARQALRRELPSESTSSWASGVGERHAAENCCDLSDEEDVLMDRLGGKEEYGDELRRLNHQVTSECSELEKEIADVKRKCAGWNDEANFRFLCIKKQFHGRSRDLMVERLCMEFPHLSREQLQAHETNVDNLKYATQRKAAAFRQWRRDRLQLLRRHQGVLEERQRQEEGQQARKQEHLGQRERQKQLHGKLDVERRIHSAKRAARDRTEDETRHRREAEEAEKEQALQRRAQEVKEKAKEIGEKKQEHKKRKEEEARERERQEAEERTRRMERNAEVVRMRREMDELKSKEQAQQRQAAEEERLERERRLLAAADKLRVEAQRDPERLHKLPEHAKADAYQDPFVSVTRGPTAGFDERRLMSDARYKLAAALQAAGLFGTKAGHEAMSRASAPVMPISQVFGGGGYPS